MFDDETTTYRVVANHKEQYSIWPDHKEIPDGWVAVGPSGSKEVCLDYIEHVWTDMRPANLRTETRDSAANSRDSQEEGDPENELGSVVDGILSQYEDRVEEYAEGRPELFGWFVARVLQSTEGEADPDVVRARLDAQLPTPYIPDDYV